MEEYVMTFRRFKSNCKNVFGPVWTKRSTCVKRMNMKWVRSKDYRKHVQCSEANCPVLNKCETIIK